MMNLIFRMLRVFIVALLKPRIGLLDCSILSFRVLPTDMDINLHMTNARYLSIMDLGRTDLLIRSGMLGPVKQERWMPVVGSVNIKYRRPLLPFQRFTVRTRLLCWDEKWLYLEQRIESARGLHSVATVRGLFLGRDGSVPSQVVLERFGHRGESPPFTREVLSLIAWEQVEKKFRSAES